MSKKETGGIKAPPPASDLRMGKVEGGSVIKAPPPPPPPKGK